MIHISHDWYIDGDSNNVILKQRKINQKDGNEYFTEVAYPGTFEQLMNSLSKRKTRLSVEKANDLKELVEIERAIQKDNAEFYKRFEKEIKERLREEKEDERADDTSAESGEGGIDEGE